MCKCVCVRNRRKEIHAKHEMMEVIFLIAFFSTFLLSTSSDGNDATVGIFTGSLY